MNVFWRIGMMFYEIIYYAISHYMIIIKNKIFRMMLMRVKFPRLITFIYI